VGAHLGSQDSNAAAQVRSPMHIEPLYLDKVEAAAFLAVSVSTFEKLLRVDSSFPKPRALSAHRNGYLLAELRMWGEQRPIAERLPPANTGHKRRRVQSVISPTAPGVRSAL